MYFFGNKRGEPLNYVTDFDYHQNAMWFNLHSEQIPYDQRPKHGEILSFVGVVVLPYVQEGQGKVEAKKGKGNERIIKFKTAAGDAEIDFAFMYPTMWYDTKDNYKVIEYKK
ncbi:hypothetical protein [Mycoplasma sp. 1654_15]|uniref:hypothetical protein n=1 Tax=Mycoplasma sp. 1654_15 TaxID=2725994 RepID=UPI001448E675|nr:hypothetical protein [Mycoplasma sp. 1654_15]QJB71445.1 hypothetical protein HF996_03160 [Mycoplasma sp. 1654_15]